MRRFTCLVITLAVCLLAITHTNSRAENYYHFWDQRFGDSLDQWGKCITTDSAGNIFLTSFVTGTVNFGGGDLTNVAASSVGLAIASFDAAGEHRWSRIFIDSDDVECLSVTTDPAGDVIIAGYFWGTVNLGGSNLVATNNDIFLAKYDGDTGAHLWSQRFGGANDQTGASVATDPSGNVLLGGYFSGTVDFGGGVLTSAGNRDAFVAKFTSAGAHVWSKRFGDASAQLATSVAADANGSVVLVGHFYGTVNFGGTTKTSAGNDDIFVAKFTSAGVHQWSQAFGDAASQGAAWVKTDADRNVLVAGLFEGTVNFNGGTLTSAGGNDIYVVKFNANGYHQWSHRFGSVMDEDLGALSVTPQGDVAITGSFRSAFSFGGGNLGCSGGTDIFVAAFSSAGVHEWSRGYGCADIDFGYSISFDNSGCVIATGRFRSPVDFGHGPVTPNGEDIFLLKLSPTLTGVGSHPITHELSISAYPNPFNPSTTIRYTVPSRGHVSVAIYDARGSHVATLVDEGKPAGLYTEPWNGRDAAGRAVSSGVYFARVAHPQGVRSYKIVLLK